MCGDSMRKFSANLKEHTSEIINCDKKEMLLLKKKQKKYKKQNCHKYKGKFDEDFNEFKLLSRITTITQGNTEEPLMISVI